MRTQEKTSETEITDAKRTEALCDKTCRQLLLNCSEKEEMK
jgi:hypothetical protein